MNFLDVPEDDIDDKFLIAEEHANIQSNENIVDIGLQQSHVMNTSNKVPVSNTTHHITSTVLFEFEPHVERSCEKTRYMTFNRFLICY